MLVVRDAYLYGITHATLPVNLDVHAAQRTACRIAYATIARIDARFAHRSPRRILHEHGVSRDDSGLYEREEEQDQYREHERELDGRLTPLGHRSPPTATRG